MKLKLKYIGTDFWDRKVYQDEKGHYYKTYEQKPTQANLYTTDSFDGEPCCGLRKDVIVEVSE